MNSKKIIEAIENIKGPFGGVLKEGSELNNKTISEKAKDSVTRLLEINALDFSIEERRHIEKMNSLRKEAVNLTNLLRTLKGEFGYVRVTQQANEFMKIESGFTAIEELVEFHKNLECYLYRPTATLGTYVYQVSENGSLNLIDSKVDSSD